MLARAWARSDSLSLRAVAISSFFAAATSAWLRRMSSAASVRAFSKEARISAAAFSASARSRFALSIASAMVFSRFSIVSRIGCQANRFKTMRSSPKVTSVQTTSATLMSVRPAASNMEPPPVGPESVAASRSFTYQVKPWLRG